MQILLGNAGILFISGLQKQVWVKQAVVASVAALSILLNKGIGDTIRVSLTPDKMGVRTKGS